MICCEYLEMLFASPEPIELVRNVSIILSAHCAYWLGVVFRVSVFEAADRRWLAHSVLAVPVSLIVMPLLLFTASTATDLESFLAVLAAGFACGTVLNQWVFAHLEGFGFKV